MMFDVVADLGTFILILVLVIFAYAQITISISDTVDTSTIDALMRQAYVLAYGDFGSFDEFSITKFMVFVVSTFIVPLVMMNLLIALISDSYATIQANQVSTNTRSLAEMLLEMEQITNLFKRVFSPDSVKNEYMYMFYTEELDTSEKVEDMAVSIGEIESMLISICLKLEISNKLKHK
jgi:hypothetical protein